MTENTIPEGLPKSQIIYQLSEKSNLKSDYEFSYIHHLDELRKVISIEITQINLLFPEYTPHDEKYHLTKLFFIADQMLEDSVISAMNTTELFLLAASLYGHDWGMAVSNEEKEIIISGTYDEKFATLDDEQIRFQSFCRDRNITRSEVETADWQEYVRQTHAFRSGKRIRKYFEGISAGIGDFCARICEGHWHNFDMIDDYFSYPTDASLHRDIVNIKAITLYVRLIDLLDLGEDRTPFVLWKFVAPRNNRSKIEWAKHRALQPVTFPNYQLTRNVQIEGSTNDQQVYMSILDLKRYINDQFRQSLDMLNRMNHLYHKLNIGHLDWRIVPISFEPVTIQFEFDRMRMFEILSDDIYQGNPFIFIRELLQNAIDAIDFRAEALAKKQMFFTPCIKISSTNNTEFYIIEISDNGIGMDEYIIRNYLALVGRSYYRSLDFQKEQLNLDPISKFGIGILSCFMLSDNIEIETFKDPNLSQIKEHLKISIPAKENYFKIQKNSNEFPIGTKFRVFLDKKKLPFVKDTPIDFNITNYLHRTAGFVKHPIIIEENGRVVQIENPSSTNLSSLRLNYTFPYEKAFKPQHVDFVNKHFHEEKISIEEDLDLREYKGCITYLIPNDENLDIINTGRSWPVREITTVHFEDENFDKLKIRWEDDWISFGRHYRLPSKYEVPDRNYSVYIDGLLLTNITPPEINLNRQFDMNYNRRSTKYNSGNPDSFVSPLLIVNIPKPSGVKIDLARTNLDSTIRWDIKIWKNLGKYLRKKYFEEIDNLAPKQILLKVGRVMTFYKIPEQLIMKEILEISNLPFPFATKDSSIEFHHNLLNKNSVKILPEIFENDYLRKIESEFYKYKKSKSVLDNYEGQLAIYSFKNPSNLSEFSMILQNALKLLSNVFNCNYFFSQIQFISSPLGKDYPIVMELHEKIPDNPHTILYSKNSPFAEFDAYNWYKLHSLLERKFKNFPKLVIFPEPFVDKLFYSFSYINVKHPKAIEIIKIALTIIEEDNNNTLSKRIVGELFDMVNDLPFIKNYYYSQNIKFNFNYLNEKIEEIYTTFNKNQIFHIFNNELITINDFVNNSIKESKKFQNHYEGLSKKKYLKSQGKWGVVLG
ncbi:HD domain-containing protein [Flavobacterium hydrophilum]|uniref:HD-CE domain-containing protein n=1 Tax=Flavobacterium hydrophilum TaxID=2211445 RepID=A0A2V4BZU9_9FLAO|nr:ATP-binding protein [Flavobacterium hydrophilum]PXY43180.1 hypothetical protein DMB68_21065 [Flavobacterium hydrophilum]